MRKPAIFIIDMLNDCFIHRELIEQRASLCKRINALVGFARDSQFHIVWVRQEFKEDLSDAFLEMRDENIEMYIEGTSGCKILDELKPLPGEHEVIKKRYSMFFRTNLDELLSTLNPSFLVLAGVNTHACIRMAAIDAYQRDHRVIIVRDCVASADQQHHDLSLKYLGNRIAKVMSSEEFKIVFKCQ